MNMDEEDLRYRYRYRAKASVTRDQNTAQPQSSWQNELFEADKVEMKKLLEKKEQGTASTQDFFDIMVLGSRMDTTTNMTAVFELADFSAQTPRHYENYCTKMEPIIADLEGTLRSWVAENVESVIKNAAQATTVRALATQLADAVDNIWVKMGKDLNPTVQAETDNWRSEIQKSFEHVLEAGATQESDSAQQVIEIATQLLVRPIKEQLRLPLFKRAES